MNLQEDDPEDLHAIYSILYETFYRLGKNKLSN
jgi:hypothetical protein